MKQTLETIEKKKNKLLDEQCRLWNRVGDYRERISKISKQLGALSCNKRRLENEKTYKHNKDVIETWKRLVKEFSKKEFALPCAVGPRPYSYAESIRRGWEDVNRWVEWDNQAIFMIKMILHINRRFEPKYSMTHRYDRWNEEGHEIILKDLDGVDKMVKVIKAVYDKDPKANPRKVQKAFKSLKVHRMSEKKALAMVPAIVLETMMKKGDDEAIEPV